MVAVVSTSSNKNLATPGKVGDGVVRIRVGSEYGTGVLLADGQHVLTAAHIAAAGALDSLSVIFETVSGTTTVTANSVAQSPYYIASNSNNDLAILTLSSTAPADANRYEIYRASDEIGQVFTFVGYGKPATGSSGNISTTEAPTRRYAENQVDGLMELFKLHYGQYMNWSPQDGKLFFADFDDGTTTHDASGRLFGLNNTGLGSAEGGLSLGDSGGPAFIGGKIAGIASYQFRFAPGGVSADIDGQTNSSFGEVNAWTRVSQYQFWIDQTLRQSQVGAPSRPKDVQKTVIEGNSGTKHVWFLVSLAQPASGGETIQFHTLDGTAKAGVDYLSVSDTLVFYTGEDHVAIPVEVVGNTRVDGNRTFSLVITDPHGGVFAGGVSQLSATRTIIDDDGIGLLGLVGVAS